MAAPTTEMQDTNVRKASHETRTGKLREEIERSGWDACVLTDMTSIRYLSGFTGSAARIVVTPKESTFITDFRYTEQAKEQVSGSRVETASGSYDEATAEALKSAGSRRVGLPNESTTLGLRDRLAERLPQADLISIPDPVAPFRMVKEPWEIEAIDRAVQLAAEVFDSILDEIKPGARECDIALELEFRMRRKGAQGAAFDTIVASGWRSSLPHGIASDKKIEKGDFVTVDMGALLDGYHSDMTRTVSVGEPTEDGRKIYDTVLEAQVACAGGVQPGMRGAEADAIARDIIEEAGYGTYFGHGTGHGIGLEVHEAPRLSHQAGPEASLVPGTVYTVEPGIYIPGMGGVRIEDIVVMEEEGPRILTPNTKELLVL